MFGQSQSSSTGGIPSLSSIGQPSGTNDLTAQLIMLARQSGMVLSPEAAAATASFMALTAQGAGNSSVLGSTSGLSVSNPIFGSPPNTVVPSAQSQLLSSLAQLTSRGQNNNATGSTVLIVSNLNEEVGFCS